MLFLTYSTLTSFTYALTFIATIKPTTSQLTGPLTPQGLQHSLKLCIKLTFTNFYV